MTSRYLMKVRALAAAAIALTVFPLATAAYGQDPATPPPTEAVAPTAEPAEPAEPAAAPAEASVEQRLADLESYFGNVGVGGSGDSTWTKLVEQPGDE